MTTPWPKNRVLYAIDTDEYPGKVQLRSLELFQELIPAEEFEITQYRMLDRFEPMARDLLQALEVNYGEVNALKSLLRATRHALAASHSVMLSYDASVRGSAVDKKMRALLIQIDKVLNK